MSPAMPATARSTWACAPGSSRPSRTRRGARRTGSPPLGLDRVLHRRLVPRGPGRLRPRRRRRRLPAGAAHGEPAARRHVPGIRGRPVQVLEQPEVFGRFEDSLADGRRMGWNQASPDWITGVAEAGTSFYARLIPAACRTYRPGQPARGRLSGHRHDLWYRRATGQARERVPELRDHRGRRERLTTDAQWLVRWHNGTASLAEGQKAGGRCRARIWRPCRRR